MLLATKDNRAIVSGRVTRGGSEVKAVGANNTPCWKANLQYDDIRREDGTFEKKYITLTAWRAVAERMPVLAEGSRILASGFMSKRSYQGRDGEQKTSTELTINDCDIIITQPSLSEASSSAAAKAAGYPDPPMLSDSDDFLTDDGCPF